MMLKAYVIDAHTHFLPKAPMMAEIKKYISSGINVPEVWDPRELENYLRYSGVSKFFMLNYAVEANQVKDINNWANEVAKKYQEAMPFCAVHPDSEGVLDEISRTVGKMGFYGVCVNVQAKDMKLDGEKMNNIYERLSVYKKPVAFVCGPEGERDAEKNVRAYDSLAKSFPEIPFLITHGCYPEIRPENETMPLLDDNENVYFDTAHVFSPNRKIDYKALLKIFETYQDRMLFGSGFPFTGWDTYDQINTLISLDIDKEALKKLKFGNAEKIILPKKVYEKLVKSAEKERAEAGDANEPENQEKSERN